MKKKIALILVLCVMATMLCSCSNISYDEAIEDNGKTQLSGYFTVVKEWTYDSERYYTVYANDTYVMYLFIDGYRSYALTPLYNTDGTLLLYEGD